MQKLIRMIPMAALMCALTIGSCYASGFGDGAELDNQNFNGSTNTVIDIMADEAKKEFFGDETKTTVQDTKTQENIDRNDKEAKRKELEKAIQELEDILSQQIGGENKPDIGGKDDQFGDYVNKHKDLLDEYISGLHLPGAPDLNQSNLNPGATFQDMLKYLEDIFYNLGTVEGSTLIYPNQEGDTDNDGKDMFPNGIENINKVTDGDKHYTLNNNTLILGQQVVANMGPFAGMALISKSDFTIPSNSNMKIEDDSEEVVPLEPFPYSVSIDVWGQHAFDFVNWLDKFAKDMLNQMVTQPGQASKDIEGYWVKRPSEELKEWMDKVHPETLPDGTEVIVPNDNSALLELLQKYLQELYQLGLSTSTCTKLTMIQLDELHQNTIHRSIPTGSYHWVVEDMNDGNNVLVERNTDTPYVKALFKGEGQYKVNVSSVNNAYRSNMVNGTVTEMYVLNNGSFFDGLVVYKNTQSFSAWVGDDIGPELVEVPMSSSGTIANITRQMLNMIQMIDTNGNVLSPASGFTTERKGG